MTTATLFALPVDETAVEFFMEHAGWSYHPDHETPEEGKRKGAETLAEAEAYAKAHGWESQWFEDYDAEYADRNDPEWAGWPQFYCIVGTVSHPFEPLDHLASLGGVMFKDKSDETGDPYARVVEAELFAQAMREHLDQIERGNI